MIGKQISHYQILEHLGSGGMGRVFRARDTRLGREVAIKFLSPEAAGDAERLERFVGEARLASSLNHPNIISLHDIGECDEGPYIVTELVQGRTLREMIDEGRPPLEECVRIFQQAADGLAKAHEAGIVHRDLKPANLMVTSDGLVKILDFGLAKLHADSGLQESEQLHLTQAGAVVGTAAYMPPERMYGAPADARSDVFSLGVVADELFHRQHPFLKESVSETLRAIMKEQPQRPPELKGLIPDALASILEKAMAKDPEDRFEDARELADALRVWASGSNPILATHTREADRSWRGWYAGAAFAAVVVSLLAYFNRPQESAPPGDELLRVAVFPAEDLTGEAELGDAQLDQILANMFVHVLTDMDDLHVVSPVRLEALTRAEGRTMEDAATDFGLAREISRSAGANAILNSTLSRVGEDFVLNATLTDLSSQDLLGSFHADSSDPAQLLTDMSTDLKLALERQFQARADATAEPATTSMRAYTHYLKGRNYFGLAEWDLAQKEYETAVQLDPEMGLAWSELGCAYSFLEEDEELVETAQTEAERWASGLSQKERWWVELNGTWLRTENGHAIVEQIEEFLEVYPDDREAIFYGGLAEQWLNGNCEAALSWFERAYALTPFYHPITKGLVDCHLELGRTADAIGSLERYLGQERAPGNGRDWASERLAEIRAGR